MNALAAPVVEVTVLEDRARVVRRGVATVAVGQQRLVVAGVAPVLVDKTLAARASAGRVLDVRCRRELARWRTGEGAGDAARSADAAALLDARDAAEADVLRRGADLAALEHELGDLERLRGVALAELAAEAAWGRAPAGADAALAGLDERERAATAALVEGRLVLERAERDLAALRARLAEAQADAGVESASIEVELAADAAGEVTITIEYLVPGACWRPYHTATLTGASVRLATDACVWQHTGEDWRDAALSFSTERPSLGARPPDLEADLLRIQKKSEVLQVEARDQTIDETGLGAERAVEEAAQVPGVDDGGVVQVLRAPHPATIPSDGRPYRVALGAHEGAAELALVAIPERAPVAILRTRQGSGPRPLLAGPVDLIRAHGHVGRTSILYVAANERFELGWGPEADLRVHRDEQRTREEAGMLGSWNETRVRVAVRLSNLGERARVVEVTERVPVSEIEKVEIKLAAPDAWTLEDDDVVVIRERTIDADGLVRWQVEVPPRDRRAVLLEYRIRAHTSVVGL